MVGKGSTKGTTRFSLKAENSVKKVQLAGDFSKWKATSMTKQKNGTFVAVVPLKPGNYEYKFIVDGQWRVDPDNGAWALNPYGTLNSVVTVQ